MSISLRSDGSGTFGALQINGTDKLTLDNTGQASATSFAANGDVISPFAGFKNKLINGNFDIWQRAISQTSTGYGSDDRWHNSNSGSTKTHSQQSFVLGQTEVPNNPKYFSRTVVSSVAGAGNHCTKFQAIEDVTLSSDKTMTLSFYAKADANKDIAVEFQQYFGTGGSPSAHVNGIGITTFNLTTSWQKFTTTVTFPSVSGKTLGTNNNHYSRIVFWFDAGSNFNANTNSLGQQSGTFDIAQVQLEEGSIATSFEMRPYGTELLLCQRYYEEKQSATWLRTTTDGNFAGGTPAITYIIYKRSAPTLIAYTTPYKTTVGVLKNSSATFTSYSGSASLTYVTMHGTHTGTPNVGDHFYGYLTLDAEL